MGNLETALSQDTTSSSQAHQRGSSDTAEGTPPDGSFDAKSSGGVEAQSGNENNPNNQHQTGATSIPISVPEVESETDVGAPSPNPQGKGPWGLFSPPDDIDLLCPTPYQSASADLGPPWVGPQEASWETSCNISGRKHLACFGEAVGHALESEGAPKGASAFPPPCPHLAAAAIERQKATPPSLLALSQLIESRMGGPQVPGLHLNSPSASPCWSAVPHSPRGSPLGDPEDQPLGAPRARLTKVKGLPSGPHVACSSTKDVSEEVRGAPGGSRGPLDFPDGGNSKAHSIEELREPPGVTMKESLYKNDIPDEEVVRICCAHIVSLQGRLGSSSIKNSSGGDSPLQALQQLSPCLQECSEAIARTMLMQGGPLGDLRGGSMVGSEGESLGASLLASQRGSLSDASLGNVSTILKQLQISIDQFTAVLSRCEDRLLTAFYRGPSRGPTGAPLPQLGTSRVGHLEALGEGAERSSGAPSSSVTNWAQEGSSLGFKETEEEAPLSPIFFLNKEPITPFVDVKNGGLSEATMGTQLDGTLSFQQQSNGETGGTVPPVPKGGAPFRGPSRGLTGSPSRGLSESPSRSHSRNISGASSEGILGPSKVSSAGPSEGPSVALFRHTSGAPSTASRGDLRGSGRAIRWARDRLKRMLSRSKRQGISD